MYQRPIVPITQLIDPIHAAYQYQHNTQAQKPKKDLKPGAHDGLFRVDSSRVADSVFDGEADEDAEGEDLEGEAREGDVNGHLAAARRDGGEGATASLEDEGEDVAGDEEPVVEFGGEAGIGGAEIDDSVVRFREAE